VLSSTRTKESATDRLHLNHGVTPRLHHLDSTQVKIHRDDYRQSGHAERNRRDHALNPLKRTLPGNSAASRTMTPVRRRRQCAPPGFATHAGPLAEARIQPDRRTRPRSHARSRDKPKAPATPLSTNRLYRSQPLGTLFDKSFRYSVKSRLRHIIGQADFGDCARVSH
jgi:hypothetical protein